MLLVSYCTVNELYQVCADRLSKQCNELHILHYIHHAEDTGLWLGNVRNKVDFLISCLDRFQQPLFYCDIDTELIQDPLHKLFSLSNVVMATPKQDNDWGLMDFCQFINYTEETYELLYRWRELLTENPGRGTHSCLSLLKKEYPEKIAWLPEGYSDGTIVKIGISPK